MTDSTPEASADSSATPAAAPDNSAAAVPAPDATAPKKKKKRNRLGLASFIFALLMLAWIGGIGWFAYQSISGLKLNTAADVVNPASASAIQALSGLFGASLGVIPVLGFVTLILSILALALNGVPGKLLGLLSLLILIALIVAIVIGIGLLVNEIGILTNQYGPALKNLLPLLGSLGGQ